MRRASLVAAGLFVLAGCGASTVNAHGTVATTTTTQPVASLPAVTPPFTIVTVPATSTTRPKTPATVPPTEPMVQLAMNNDLTTVKVRVGQSVELTLSGASLVWKLNSPIPAGLLASDPAPASPDNGVLAIWTALRAGSVQIGASGSVRCEPGQVCPMFIQFFKVTLDIS